MSVSGMMKISQAALTACLLTACATNGAPEQAIAPQIKEIAPQAPVFIRADILGQSAASLDRKLGAPALVRQEGDGEFRRYTLRNCGLIVIFYPVDEGRKTATHMDTAARSSEEEKPDLDTCLAAGLAPQATGV